MHLKKEERKEKGTGSSRKIEERTGGMKKGHMDALKEKWWIEKR